MKNITAIIVLTLGILFSFTNCSEGTQKEEVQEVKKENILKLVLNVEGMTCEGCENSIQNNLLKLDGVVSAKASHLAKTATIDFDKTKIDAQAIEKEILETGYKIQSTPEGSNTTQTVQKATKSAMKCGEGKCA